MDQYAASRREIQADPNAAQQQKKAAAGISLASSLTGVSAVSRVTRDSTPEDEGVAAIQRPAGTDTKAGTKISHPLTHNVQQSRSKIQRTQLSDDWNFNSENKEGELKNSLWRVNGDLMRKLPSYYPLEKTSRFVHGEPSDVSERISECCRIMSVQGSFDDKTATASLITEEHVEIHLSLWAAPDHASNPDMIIVEAQRRTGDSIKFHFYTRHLLDAAAGKFEASKFKSPSNPLPVMERKEKAKAPSDQEDHSLLALEIAASLLKKDRMDARRLGMESLCFLTDVSRTGKKTALFASRVVLFGSANNDEGDDDFLNDDLGVREAILSLVQFGRLGDFGTCAEDVDSPDTDMHPEEKEFNELLHNLALAVLANALEVLENEESEEETSMSPPMKLSDATDTFLDESMEISNRDLLDTLLKVLSHAEAKPHDACLSAQCLRSLLQASKKARRKARNLNAKQIVSTALEVGQRTHVKLQTETEKVMQELEKVENDENEDVEM